MIARIALWASTLAALVLVASFGLFAIDQAHAGSKHQEAKVNSEVGPPSATVDLDQADPSPRTERQREKKHGDVREAIDDANDVLVSPFTGAVDSNSLWVQRGVPTLIALLLFGACVRVLAGCLRGGTRC